MGFDLLLIATSANGMTIPFGAKCCICQSLLDDGVGLSGCQHNACFRCMKKTASDDSKCPIDGQLFDMRKYYHLEEEIEMWLSNIKLKCQWFDGQICTATAIALRNAHRHRDICPNNPKNKMSREQLSAVKLVHNWMQNNQIIESCHTSDRKCDNGSDSCDGLKAKVDETSMDSSRQSKPTTSARLKPRSGYGFRPNKRTIGLRFFTNDLNPEIDSDWRK